MAGAQAMNRWTAARNCTVSGPPAGSSSSWRNAAISAFPTSIVTTMRPARRRSRYLCWRVGGSFNAAISDPGGCRVGVWGLLKKGPHTPHAACGSLSISHAPHAPHASSQEPHECRRHANFTHISQLIETLAQPIPVLAGKAAVKVAFEAPFPTQPHANFVPGAREKRRHPFDWSAGHCFARFGKDVLDIPQHSLLFFRERLGCFRAGCRFVQFGDKAGRHHVAVAVVAEFDNVQSECHGPAAGVVLRVGEGGISCAVENGGGKVCHGSGGIASLRAA